MRDFTAQQTAEFDSSRAKPPVIPQRDGLFNPTPRHHHRMDYYRLQGSTATGMAPRTTRSQLYHPQASSQHTLRQSASVTGGAIRCTYLPPQHQYYQPQEQPQAFHQQQQSLAQQQLLLQQQQQHFFLQQQFFSQPQNYNLNSSQSLTMPAPITRNAHLQQTKKAMETHPLTIRFQQLKSLPKSAISTIPIQELHQIQAYQEEYFTYYASWAQTQPNQAEHLDELENLRNETIYLFENWYVCVKEQQQNLKFRYDKARLDLECEQKVAEKERHKVLRWVDQVASTRAVHVMDEWEDDDGDDDVLLEYRKEGVPVIEKGYVNFVDVAKRLGFKIPRAVWSGAAATKKRLSDDEFDKVVKRSKATAKPRGKKMLEELQAGLKPQARKPIWR